ncbi:coiled-coil domain-containing protein 105-like [Argonauta hians]
MAELSIGTEEWRNRTLRGVQVAQDIVKRTDRFVSVKHSQDPSAFMRDVLLKHANDAILRYLRQVREVAMKLRRFCVKINYEIISCTRMKEKLEKELDFIRKDIVTNRDSQRTRRYRPASEKLRDGADDLLSAEMKHLVNSKKVLEVQLLNIHEALQDLQSAQKYLKSTLKERNHVMDLTSQSVSTLHHKPALEEKYPPNKVRSPDPRLGSYQPNPINLPDAATPDVVAVSRDVKGAIEQSKKARKEAEGAVSKMKKLNEAAHISVNKGLLKKVTESNDLVNYLKVNYGENRRGLNKANNQSDRMELSKNILLRNKYLMCSERIDRPMVEIYKRHDGQDLSGSKDIKDATKALLSNLEENSRHIDMLNLAKLNIHQDIRCKKMGSHVDLDVLKLRKKQALRKWPIQNRY